MLNPPVNVIPQCHCAKVSQGFLCVYSATVLVQIIFLKPSRLVLSLCIAQSLLYYGSLMILCWRLTLLDITLAFDAVAHKTLLSRLEYFVGIQGTDLSWFKSYLTNISLPFFSPLPAKLSCGVPQGSILAPILFSLYLLPSGSISRKHGV